MTAHTPGPWRVEDIGIADGYSVVANEGPPYEWAFVAHVGEDAKRGIALAHAGANARLIAQAPAFYAAAADLLRRHDTGAGGQCDCFNCEAFRPIVEAVDQP